MSDEMPIEALIAQGCCCGSGCFNCPYIPVHQAGSIDLNQDWINFQHTHPGISRDQYEQMKASGTLPA
ncbi:hypothetical protein C5B42_04620 [Candidatus Cerribacteria bacterium 'Amazon FNV 2010 28 9']|uniref:Oxidoreductase-like domain-containing protein n=1 Tax=Candidatus Cerribacteria bacterium 'Amazon FNV 2010 28 9' TaxID=2081795 RepID=A0A317JMN7_9BACT|nr:MAG: hypothetical protein C5B42_04620 [Candidatus Cerribacteria bacterium 'Amazon FNV 2010 28 9']